MPLAPLLVVVQATQLPALLLQCIQATGQGEQTTMRGVASWGHVGPRVPTGWLGRVHPHYCMRSRVLGATMQKATEPWQLAWDPNEEL